MKKVAVVGLQGGWSSERLVEAVARLTGFHCLIDMSEVTLDVTADKVWFRGLDLTGLDAIIVKKVGRAYSPKMLDRLEMLQVVASRGVKIFSPPENIIRVLNRLNCTVSLHQAGVPVPPTIVTEEPNEAVAAVERFGRAVLKPLYTSKARGMLVVEPGPRLMDEILNYQAYSPNQKIIYIQKFMNLPGYDLGLVFLGGKYLATYARVAHQGTWTTSTATGGRYRAAEPDPGLIEIADRAQRVFNLDFTCVDVAETDQGPVVFEVSAFGGLRGLVEGCGLDAASAYAAYVLNRI